MRIETSVRKLPDMCFIFSPDARPGEYVKAVMYGKSGCFATTYDETDPKKAEMLVAYMNQKLGVSDLHAECMQAGSMFGWGTPVADPASVTKARYHKEVIQGIFASATLPDGYAGATALVAVSLVAGRIVYLAGTTGPLDVAAGNYGVFDVGLPPATDKEEAVWLLEHHPSSRASNIEVIESEDEDISSCRP